MYSNCPTGERRASGVSQSLWVGLHVAETVRNEGVLQVDISLGEDCQDRGLEFSYSLSPSISFSFSLPPPHFSERLTPGG